MDLTKEEFQEWWHSKATQEVLRHFADKRRALMEYLAFGDSINEDNPAATAQTTARAVGKIEGLSYLLEELKEYDD